MLRVPLSDVRPCALHLSTCLLLGVALGRASEAQCSVTMTVPPHAPGGTEIMTTLGIALGTCPTAVTLNLSASTYNELVTIPTGVEVTINGALPFGSSVLDGTGLFGSVITVSGSQTNASVFQNFFIKNGTAFQGGGMSILANARPVVRNLSISNCTAQFDGGAIFVDATPSGVAPPPQILRITRLLLKANHADGLGGAIEVTGPGSSLSSPNPPDDVLIRLSEFGANTAGSTGSGSGFGGALETHGGAAVHVDHTMVSSNTADVSGGAFAARESGRLRVSECVFEDNHATGLAAFADYGGGAIFASFAGLLSVQDSQFDTNTADVTGPFITAHGGHVLVRNGSDGPPTTYLFRNDLFVGGKATDGGAMSVYTDAPTDVELCTFTTNKATAGGAIFSGASSSTVSPRVVDSIAFFDSATTPDPVTGSLEIFAATTVQDVLASDIQMPVGTYPLAPGATVPNINANPLWVSGYLCPYAPNGGFFLTATPVLMSPCVDKGTMTAYPQIVAGFSTDVTGIMDAPPVDMGYHHLPTTCP